MYIENQKQHRSVYITTIQVQEQEKGIHQGQQEVVRYIRKEEHRKRFQENDQILQIHPCHRTLAGKTRSHQVPLISIYLVAFYANVNCKRD